tara:strand:- start:5008 stop:5643 length:636 start_codon:yes stop_codon:yes gene_type:complete
MEEPRIYAPHAIEPAYEALKSYLEDSVAAGAEFKVDDTIQMSWIWLQVSNDERGKKVTAPVYPSMPMEFSDDCSDALNLMIRQRYVADSFGEEPGWCNACQSAIVIKDLYECEQWFMNRMDPEEASDSGWFVGAEDSNLDVNVAKNLERKSLWELYCHREEIGEFFLLPVDWGVDFEAEPVVWHDNEQITPLPGSYLEAKTKANNGWQSDA